MEYNIYQFVKNQFAKRAFEGKSKLNLRPLRLRSCSPRGMLTSQARAKLLSEQSLLTSVQKLMNGLLPPSPLVLTLSISTPTIQSLNQ